MLRDAAEALLRRRYRFADIGAAETLVALGGDGFMLQTLHRMLEQGCTRPVFGMNRGTVGFLMNDWRIDRLPERIAAPKRFASRRWKCARRRSAAKHSPMPRSMKSRC